MWLLQGVICTSGKWQQIIALTEVRIKIHHQLVDAKPFDFHVFQDLTYHVILSTR